ncbi:MAG: efflux RND transporter permease subunit [Gemmatimonadaceae bacterium]|nr:efflux RND transporter permease subunit [Gemmatimonadaceae bacterium]
MKLIDYFVRNAQLTLVLLFALLAAGVQALLTIPRAEDPLIEFPGFTIVAVNPGAAPGDVEQLVVNPIEKRLKELSDIKKIRTTIADGIGVIFIEFNTGTVVREKKDDVIREVNQLRPTLPPELALLDVLENSTGTVNILQYALTSATAPYATLDARSRALKDLFASVPGVRAVERVGAPVREVQVSLDLGRLGALHLPLHAVLGALGSESANVPGGSVDVGRKQFVVKTSGSFTSLDQVRNTVVGGTASQVVRLRDVAAVQWGYADATHITRHDGERAVFLAVSMRAGANITDVAPAVAAVADEFRQALPAGMSLQQAFDQSENVKSRLGRLVEDFGIAIALVLLTLLPLGLRAAGVVMVSIPLSLAVGTVLLQHSGFTLNQLTIVGFVIALGLLVDDSIVVVENISRFLRRGMPRQQAAIAATRQITPAILGATGTLIFAFVPLMLLPGGPGDYIRSLPAAVISTILASLVVSLVVIPFLASVVMPRATDVHGNRVLRWLEHTIDATYTPLLHRALARPVATLGVALALFAGSLALIPLIGFSLFPKAGIPQFRVTVQMPDDASIAHTDSAARFVERTLRARPEVAHVLTNVGHGNPYVYYNVMPVNNRANFAEVVARVTAFDPRATPRMLDSLRTIFDGYPDGRIAVLEYENGPPLEAPIAIRFLGPDLDTLRMLAGRFERLLAAIPGTRDIDNPLGTRRSNIRLTADRARAGLLGVQVVDVDRVVRLGLAGLPAGRIQDTDGEAYDVTARLARSGRATPGALRQLYVPAQTGAHVPLAQVATLSLESALPRIDHYDTQRSVAVTAEVRTGFNTDRLTRIAMDSLASWELPAGYRWRAAGEIESREQSFGGFGGAILLATFGILVVLILEFKTFKSMLIVASVIPLGVIGGMVGLFLSGYTLSFTAMIGFVALIGIEIKNSLLLVDYTNQLRAAGAGIDHAIEEAGRVRFLPIVLTTATAIGGLLPLALQGSSLYSPLAIVIIGGLVSSLLLSRLVTPVLYKLLPPAVDAADDADAAQALAMALP